MAKSYDLEAAVRDRAGKGAARAVRRQGLIPGVIYGDKKEPALISMEYLPVKKLHETGRALSTLVALKVGNSTERVIARDIQFDPVMDNIIHVDFLRISKGAKLQVEVHVHFANEEDSPGLRRGGVLNVVRHAVEVNCPADSIPESFDVDLTGLDIGDAIHGSDIKLPDGVTYVIDDRDFTIATVAAPTIYEEPETEDADAEPDADEVPTIGEDEEGAEAAEGEGGGE